MVVTWIVVIVLALQCIGFTIAKKKSDDIPGLLDYLISYNIKAGCSAFYLIALIWISTSLAGLITTSPALYSMISASIFLAGIALPYKMYSRYRNRKDEAA
ncbi:hypothetical protein [Paenibacillus taichungensis]